jgi:hypothetical protein
MFRTHREAYPRVVDNMNTVVSLIEAHYLSENVVSTLRVPTEYPPSSRGTKH